MKQNVTFHDIGRIEYKAAWDYQEELHAASVAIKLKNRDLPKEEQEAQQHHLIFCEHPPVYTLGKSGSMDNLLLNEAQLAENGIGFYKTSRGGDITFHGPEQIVGYPILDLEYFFTDIHRYLRYLEEMIIRTLADYGVEAGRLQGATGVWLDPDDITKARKICAMGVRCSRWITMHGFAFNINTDLEYFKHIIPCGIDDKDVTSLKRELDREIDVEAIKTKLKGHFETIFNAQLV